MKLTDLLDQIDHLDKETTQAPWKSHFGGNPHDEWLSVEPEKGSRTICTVTDDHHPNAEFIALSRTALPQLAKALRAVLEVHHKTEHQRAYGFPRADKWEHYCTEDNHSWPCPTVQAITDALNGQD